MLPSRLPEPGPLLTYLRMLAETNQAHTADKVRANVRAALETAEGAMLLELLEKAVLDFGVPISADPRALEARNAQSFIVHDLRRILSNETEQLRKQAAESAGGRRVPRAGS